MAVWPEELAVAADAGVRRTVDAGEMQEERTEKREALTVGRTVDDFVATGG